MLLAPGSNNNEKLIYNIGKAYGIEVYSLLMLVGRVVFVICTAGTVWAMDGRIML